MEGRLPDPEVVAEVDRLFCGPEAPYGDYKRVGAGEMLVPHAMFRFALATSDARSVNLQLYRGIDTIGGALWTREVRALLRVASRGHPAIPIVLSGAYLEKHDLAFVVTEAAHHRMSAEGAMAFVGSKPEEALRQLVVLAHGLSLLHEQGITHQNLHPDAIEYIEGDSGGSEAPYSLRFCRFEMSSMFSNLVRRQLAGERLEHGDVRQIYLQSTGNMLAYCPPERAQWLLAPGGSPLWLESDRSDVYSLGVLAWRWLVEPLPASSQSPYAGRLDWSHVPTDVDSVRHFGERLRAGLHNPRVPRPLADLLRAMLAWDPRDRPSIVAVLRDLTMDYGRVVASLAAAEESAVYYVGFMPVPSRSTIYEKWGWIDQDPTTDIGKEQLRALLEADLRSAELLYCPEGFSGYQRASDPEELKAFQAAKYVLAGKQAYWFCDVWFERGPSFSPQQKRVQQLLVIKYVRHHSRAWRLGETPLRRRVPGEVRFIPVYTGRAMDLTEVRTHGTAWPPLLESVRFEQATPPWMQSIDDALSFLLALRGAELDARVFPFQVVGNSGDTHTIRVDTARDRIYQFRGDALRSLYFNELRPPMGRLFEGMDGESTSLLAVFADEGGRPNYQAGTVAAVVFHEYLDEETIQVRVIKGRYLPETGWIRPAEDQAAFVQLRNQEDAVTDLLRGRTLLEQLHAPTAIKGIRKRWKGVGEDLAGRGPDIVKDILTSEPFYALHGPPGSGKTTVASVAVAAHLRADPSQRILVSSQSHYALDNLARRILGRCRKEGLDAIAVRIASPQAVTEGKVHASMVPFLSEHLAARVVEDIQRCLRTLLDRGELEDGRPLTNELKELVALWREQAPRVELEIRDRVRRGANLVFATTGGCSERNVSTAGTNGLYDWVIVEEAARAWPTELAMPLVRGLRWTLIGDHFQLPAFDELSVRRFLQLCGESGVEDLQLHAEHQQAYLDVFNLFGSLFEKRSVRRAGRPVSATLVEPLDELDLQFRMHPDICRVVSRAFYRTRTDPGSGELRVFEDGWLRADERRTRKPHGLHAPAFLESRAVVWLDTKDVEDSGDQHAWRNEGEARLIRRLLEQFHPAPLPPSRGEEDDTFAILTPYGAQINELAKVEMPAWTRGRIHTVDSFQGREADVVIVSLVRATQRDARRPEANIGYLVSPNRINVLLSRARRLLVIVGRIGHFEQQVTQNPDRKDIAFWRTITGEIRRQNAVVPATKVFGGLP